MILKDNDIDLSPSECVGTAEGLDRPKSRFGQPVDDEAKVNHCQS